MKYIAIKVKGINHWIWFEKEKAIRQGGNFIGDAGWGKDGAYTSITISESQIEGEITSDSLQY